jgi:hypothetical protein
MGRFLQAPSVNTSTAAGRSAVSNILVRKSGCIVKSVEREEKGFHFFGQGKELEGHLADNAQASKGPHGEFGDVIARNVLDGFPPEPRMSPVGLTMRTPRIRSRGNR